MKKEIIFEDPGLINSDVFYLTAESDRQFDLHGIQKVSPFEWLTFLAEEVGELAEAITEFVYRDGPAIEISKEAISVATLALKISKMAVLAEGVHE